LYNAASVKIANGNAFTDVAPAALPLNWSFVTPIAITDFAANYTIQVLDNDAPLTSDFIGGYNFKVNDLKAGYPATYILQNSTSALKIQLTLSWQ
jgi:hypothetical protein